MTHLLDANVFIAAKNFYYRHSICPGFWEWLDSAVGGEFGTIDRVCSELTKGKDVLSEWFSARKDASWVASTKAEKTQQAMVKVANWVAEPNKRNPVAQAKFLGGADPWLLAHAMANGSTVVTLETPKNSPNVVSLADACAAFGVPVIKTWELLELRKVQFVLPKKK